MTLGCVEPRSGEIKVAAPVPGRIADVLVKANEDVFAGQLLVRLDDEEALARVAEADAQSRCISAPATTKLLQRARRIGERPRTRSRISSEVPADALSALDKITADGGQAPRRRPISMRRAPLWRVCRIACGTSRPRSPT